MDSSATNKWIRASDAARRSSDDFRETYGRSPLESIAPFDRDEIILGRRLGSGAFSSVYESKGFTLRSNLSDMYTEEHVKKRDATAEAVTNGAKYVMKCLKDKFEHSDSDSGDEDLFLCAAQDITHEAEMLAALSHPNIIELRGVVASGHKAFLNGASQFFIILEQLESTLTDKIEVWTKDKGIFSLSSSLNSLSSLRSSLTRSNRSSSFPVDEPMTSEGKGSSLQSRLRVIASLADAVEYLHSQGVIFRDLKPDNVGFDRQGILKLFDFGLSKFMPRDRDTYNEVYEMSITGTPRYTAPEVMFKKPYNLKADVYSLSVVLWEVMCLKKPFAKYKQRKDLEAMLRADKKTLAVDRRWPRSLRDIMERGLSRDASSRPTVSEVGKVLTECASASDSGGIQCRSSHSFGSTLDNSFGEFLLQEDDQWDGSDIMDMSSAKAAKD